MTGADVTASFPRPNNTGVKNRQATKNKNQSFHLTQMSLPLSLSSFKPRLGRAGLKEEQDGAKRD